MRHLKIASAAISLALLAGAFGLGSPAKAGMIGFLAEIHTRNGTFAIQNISDSAITLDQVIVQLGDDTFFDTAAGDGGAAGGDIDPVSQALAVATGGSPIVVTHDFTVTPGPDGFTAPTDAGSALSLTGALAAAVADGAQSATLNFLGFDPGDAWGFRTDFDEGTLGPNNNDSREIVEGFDMNNATVTAMFSNGQILSTTFEGGPTTSSNSGKVSFPFGASAVANFVVPEPSSAVLVAMGALGLVSCAPPRRRRAG